MRTLNFTIFLFFFSLLLINARSIEDKVLDYTLAREYAFEGKEDTALWICDSLLEVNPNNVDVIVLKARVLGWQGKYSDAKQILQEPLLQDSTNYDLLDAVSDIDYWNKNYYTALQHVDDALDIYQNDSLFLAKKERLEGLLQKPRQPVYTTQNCLLLQYYFDYFDEFYERRWHVFTLGFPLNYYDTYLLIPKMNLGHLSSVAGVNTYTALQIESDFYYTPEKKYYLYGNLGFSNSRLFPEIKMGAEYFRSLANGFEVSAGMRYMKWEMHNVYATFSGSKYFGRNYAMLRTFLSMRDLRETSAIILEYRRYFVDTDFVGLSFVFGTAPDQSYDQFIEYGSFRSQKIILKGSKTIKTNYKINAAVSYSNEEYRLNQFQNRFDLLVGVTYCY